MLKQFVQLQVAMKSRKKGQSLAEYGLILALVAVFCIVALETLGGSISTMMDGLSASIAGVATGPG